MIGAFSEDSTSGSSGIARCDRSYSAYAIQSEFSRRPIADAVDIRPRLMERARPLLRLDARPARDCCVAADLQNPSASDIHEHERLRQCEKYQPWIIEPAIDRASRLKKFCDRRGRVFRRVKNCVPRMDARISRVMVEPRPCRPERSEIVPLRRMSATTVENTPQERA
jgi:hypothetical protein